jgi:CRISPR-associated protein Cas1
MYEKRFAEKIDPDTHIQAVRGKEGYRVRSAYQRYAAEMGLEWKGRQFDPQNWGRGDPLNRALSAASACLNGIVHAGVVSAGYSAAIGFVHTGKMLSFVYDIADLYKVGEIVPLVFQAVAQSDQNIESRVRLACRDLFRSTRFLERLLPDIREVLDGRDDSGASSAEPAGGSESLDDRAEGRNIPWPHDRADS